MQKASFIFLLPFFLFISCTKNIAPKQITGTWVQKSAFPGFGKQKAFCFSIGNKGYVGTGYGSNSDSSYAKGNDFWQYDPILDQWVKKDSFANGLTRVTACGFSIGSKGYAGLGIDLDSLEWQKDFWEYDTSTDYWTKKADFGGGIRNIAVAFSIGTKGYIGFGGDPSPTNDLWEYDPSNDTWIQKANLPGERRAGAINFVIGNYAYIGTGMSTGYALSDFWAYNSLTNAWTKKSDVAGGRRSYSSGFSIGNKGYICLGEDSAGHCLSNIWEYDPVTDYWTPKNSFPGKPRKLAVVFTVNNRAYLGTGEDFYNPYTSFNDFWEFTP